MLHHVILWKLDSSYTEEEKKKIMSNAKAELEALKGKIDGIVTITLSVDALSSSNADMMLDSTFTDKAAYETYRTHPAHVAVADKYIRPYSEVRLCYDEEET